MGIVFPLKGMSNIAIFDGQRIVAGL